MINISRHKVISAITAIIVVVLGVVIVCSPNTKAYAAITSTAKVSFTFDDNLQSTYTNAAPILKQYGLTGTDYAISGCVGMTTVPNTCNANQDTPYMTWAQLQAMQNTYGWEVGSHTVDHVCLASSAETDPSDCANPAPLTTAQVDAELANSKSAIAANGINATDFAPPYGDYNNNVLAQIAKYYASMRQFNNVANNLNYSPYSDYYLQDYTVQEKTDPVSAVEAQINTAIANGTWLVLTFHNILPNPSQNPDDYEYGTTELQQIAAYVQAKQAAGQIQSVHVDQGLVTSSTNLLPNGNFAAGISNGWTTDSPSTIVADANNNGSYPNSTYSVKFTSTTKTAHLFSPKVAVNPLTTYTFKNFLNVLTNKGTVGYYIDEYNAQGQWISGQYKAGESSAFVEDINFNYTPSSANVAYAALQIIITGPTGTTGYLANAQMFPVGTQSTTDLLPNSNFNAGISDGWTTDAPTTVTGNTGNNGSPADPADSVELVSTTVNTHLFSPKIAVTYANTYFVSAWLNLKQITSGDVVGFYIDEYNSSGAWISGQYKLSATTLGARTYTFSYTPTSANVAYASVQVIVVGNSNTVAYLDDLTFSLL